MERITVLVMGLATFCDTIYAAITTYASDLNVLFVRLDQVDTEQRRLGESLRRLEEGLRRLEEHVGPEIKGEEPDGHQA